MSSIRRPHLRLLSLNVNGLRSNPEKRRQLFHGIQQGRYDIICLQEPHHSSEAEASQWMQEGSGPGSAWLGPAYWCHFSTASRGVAILFSNTLPWADIHRVGNDPFGRLLRVDFTFQGNPFTVTTVYAPSDAASRPPFFTQLHTHFTNTTGRYVLCGGDFNCVADRRLDRVTAVLAQQSTLSASPRNQPARSSYHSPTTTHPQISNHHHTHQRTRIRLYRVTKLHAAAKLDR